MSRRTEVAYSHLFRYIHNNICSLEGISFITDYEIAMRTAIRHLYPNSKFLACWFHFCQAAQRRVSKLPGLAKLIKKDEKARKIYKKFLALPLLPADEIVAAFERIKTEALTQFGKLFHPFLKYFEKQWIKKVNCAFFVNFSNDFIFSCFNSYNSISGRSAFHFGVWFAFKNHSCIGIQQRNTKPTNSIPC